MIFLFDETKTYAIYTICWPAPYNSIVNWKRRKIYAHTKRDLCHATTQLLFSMPIRTLINANVWKKTIFIFRQVNASQTIWMWFMGSIMKYFLMNFLYVFRLWKSDFAFRYMSQNWKMLFNATNIGSLRLKTLCK